MDKERERERERQMGGEINRERERVKEYYKFILFD